MMYEGVLLMHRATSANIALCLDCKDLMSFLCL